MEKHSLKELHQGAGQTGLFGEIFVGLGLLIGIVGGVFLTLSATGFYDDSVVGAQAARTDWIALGFLFMIEGIGFAMFGVLALVSGWDRHHHADTVH